MKRRFRIIEIGNSGKEIIGKCKELTEEQIDFIWGALEGLNLSARDLEDEYRTKLLNKEHPDRKTLYESLRKAGADDLHESATMMELIEDFMEG